MLPPLADQGSAPQLYADRPMALKRYCLKKVPFRGNHLRAQWFWNRPRGHRRRRGSEVWGWAM